MRKAWRAAQSVLDRSATHQGASPRRWYSVLLESSEMRAVKVASPLSALATSSPLGAITALMPVVVARTRKRCCSMARSRASAR